MSNKCLMSIESLKLTWMPDEDDVMKSCFYCKRCEKRKKFYKIRNECETKGFLSFNKEVTSWEVIYREKNKHF